MSSNIEILFPKLRGSEYSITSPATPEYNCIAWAAGDTEAWWWPDSQNIYYWPPDVPRSETLAAFLRAYEILGYSRCHDANTEEGFEKVALYIGPNGKPTHAARQLPSGSWTSKLGQLEDIEHRSLESLINSPYGSIAVILKRSKRTR
jgi:hypothetical protein